MKLLQILYKPLLITLFSLLAFTDSFSQNQTEEYVMISLRYCSSLVCGEYHNLWVYLDFGDESEEIEKAKYFEKVLEEKKSNVAVLNYMNQRGYSLVETIPCNSDGDLSSIIYIMKKKLQ